MSLMFRGMTVHCDSFRGPEFWQALNQYELLLQNSHSIRALAESEALGGRRISAERRVMVNPSFLFHPEQESRISGVILPGFQKQHHFIFKSRKISFA